jgi:hypothetical protein
MNRLRPAIMVILMITAVFSVVFAQRPPERIMKEIQKGQQTSPSQPSNPSQPAKQSNNFLLYYKSNQTAQKNTPVMFKSQPAKIKGADLVIEAYCGDDTPGGMAVIRFDAAGRGGFLGCEKSASGEFFGDGVIKQGEVKTWTYDLGKVKIAKEKEGIDTINFIDIINSKYNPAINCWVSAGSKSWVTVRIILK